ncbi:MAG: GreA/GreB family elongation factor [Ruminococcus sp.]|nr:GreA/GreB family elongation factor [Ruminococcus sp.]
MKEYRVFKIKNGDTVNGYIDNDFIYFYYKEKPFKIPVTAIGNLIFYNDLKIEVGSIVEIKQISTGKTICVKLCKNETEIKYYGMGGSFYGANTREEIMPVSKNESDKIKNISLISPIGKALINHRAGDFIDVLLPSGIIEKYYIINIT